MPILFLGLVILATLALSYIAWREPVYKKIAAIGAAVVFILGLCLYFFVILPAYRPPLPPASDAAQREEFLKTEQATEDALKAKLGDKQSYAEGDISAIIDLAFTHMQQTEYDAAIALLDTAWKQFPKNEDLHQQLVVAYFSKGLFLGENNDYAAAHDSLKKARAIMPEAAPFAKQLDVFINIMAEKSGLKKPEPPKLPTQPSP